ncbi:hypothetical protein OROGR_027758 [Orobanche gracilis]
MAGKVSLCRQSSSVKKADHDGQRKGCTRSCDFGAMSYLIHVCEKVLAAPSKSRHSDHNKERAKANVDSQRAKAIDDCIDFINSSSSFPRSNSVAR